MVPSSNAAGEWSEVGARVRRWLRPSTNDMIWFYRHPLSWWRQFENAAKVEVALWRPLTNR